ncbi:MULTISPECIES: LysM peptidoglycan-binding domain-containing protein [unclassified Streptomyces]|uniref:LysM peptidoglycan-binding domain-containing protein n=1 Tax=unclassified Streptomyces TaxID=2593676 RepID=UPI0022721020|nr:MULTISPECIES: LysM peptidoglycan-binding domain-containing protein [unclassified Streptomyces]MCY0923429.1 LysM peptidoglycan-binding domain-containing protein [Streptomyces sp. H27-G5]MCY0961861.1 LysM peptidoglycan-binding domain-containing protein [Streptomyces sp. H27-H5]
MSKPPTAGKPAPPVRGAAQTAAAMLRGILSLTILAALLVGLPVLLWWATARVGPPGLDALAHLFSTDDSGQVFLLVLAVAGWVGWVLFACAVLLEIPAQLRGRAAPQIRGLVGQRAAAALVGAVFLALPAGTALAAPATAAPTSAPVSISATATPGTTTTAAAGTTGAVADEGGSAAVTYRVRDVKPAESLWSIAEHTLGDGERWTEIAAANENRVMVDGTMFRADQPIQPGWVLTLPADASTTTPAGIRAQTSRTAPVGVAEYTVQEGDSLSTVADEQLDDADRYPEIFELNQGAPLPEGGAFTDPDLIYPGQKLALPAADSTPAPQAPTPAPEVSRPTTPPADTPVPTPTAPSAKATPTPQSSATPKASTTPKPSAAAPTAKASPPPQTNTPTQAGPTASPSASAAKPNPAASTSPKAAAPATPAAAPAAPRAQLTGSSVNWVLVAGIGTLLAASLAGALGVRRILQQRQRRAGETIAQDSVPTEVEQVLDAAAEPQGIDFLDRALRALAHQAGEDGISLPALRGARLTADGITLLLDEPADPVAPFTTGPEARTWALDPAAVLPTVEELGDVHAPYPGLVTLGADDDGLLLADLTTCGVLLLDGTSDEVLEVARALALELGTCRWTDYSEILTTGLGARLSGLLPQGRIRTMPHLPAVATDLGELLLEAHQSGEQVLPWLMIGAGEHDEEHVTQLADALAAARTLHTAVVLPATATARRAFPHAEILDTTRDQSTRLEPLDLPVTLQRITDEQYRQYVHALTVSAEEAEPATGAWEFVENHDQAAASGQPLTVRITSQDAQDPGNPFPALLAGLPTPTPSPTAATIPAPAAPADEPAAAEPDPDTGATPGAATQPQPPTVAAGKKAVEVRIEMLGPLGIKGGVRSAHASRTTALAALIHLRPGRSAEAVCQAMDPINPWSTRTLHSRLSELRNVVGLTEDGHPLLPRPKAGDGYAFHPAVTSDWEEFKALASRGLAAGPKAGTEDLETAMALVRGKPFDGRTLPWADPVIQEMMSRITDTAHTLARWHTDGDTPDLDAARHAVLQALDVEETSEVLYRDLLRIDWTAGNTTAVRKTVARVQQMARTYDITLDDSTEDTITRVLSQDPYPAAHRAATS